MEDKPSLEFFDNA